MYITFSIVIYNSRHCQTLTQILSQSQPHELMETITEQIFVVVL